MQSDTGHFDRRTEKVVPKNAVVLDPDDLIWDGAEDLRSYAKGLVSNRHTHIAAAELIREIADQIEAQTKPPRIPKPGRWGVVEAACVHSDLRRQWLHADDGNWYPVERSSTSEPDDWDSLVDPTLIRPGI